MNNLIKIKDVSSRYDITARTLRYYEDMGLINSIRSDDYAYRMYDEEAVARLEQILILRKLNISIKDIQKIFATLRADVVLEVLNKKAQNIDDEVALLHELKDIVLNFIREIEELDFSKNPGIKQLYDKARTLEIQLNNAGNDKTSNVSRLLKVTESLRKPPEVRIVDMKPFKAVTTGFHKPDDLFADDGVVSAAKSKCGHLFKQSPISNLEFVGYDCPHFFSQCGKCGNCKMLSCFIWAVGDNVTEAEVKPYELTEIKGGLYAVVMSVDEDAEMIDGVEEAICKWIDTSGFIFDKESGRYKLSTMINPSNEIRAALGYDQIDIYMPIKIRENVADLNINPYPRMNFWCPSGGQTIDLISDGENRKGVLKVPNPNSWAVVSYSLEKYKGKNVDITFSVEIKRIGASGRLYWSINNSDYPQVGESIENVEVGVWHKMSGVWSGVLNGEFPALSLDSWENNSDKTTYYIAQFDIKVNENKEGVKPK